MKYSELIIPGLLLTGGFIVYRSVTGVASKLNPDNRDNWIYNLVPEELGDWWHEINNRPRPDLDEMFSGEEDPQIMCIQAPCPTTSNMHTMPDGTLMKGATHSSGGGY